MVWRKTIVEKKFTAAGPGKILWRDLRGRIQPLVGIGSHNLTEQLFAASFSVSPCSIEEIAAELDGALQGSQRLFIIRAGPTARAPHSKANSAYLPTGSAELSISHCALVLCSSAPL